MKTRQFTKQAKPSKADAQKVINSQFVALIVDLQNRVKELEGYAHVHVTPEGTPTDEVSA